MRIASTSKILTLLMVLLSAFLIFPTVISAQNPEPPMILSGYAYINGVRADDGTPVVATIDGVSVANVVTKTSNGLKGYFVFSFNNDTNFNLHLFVAGIEANESPISYNRWLGGMGNCLDSPKDLHVQMTTQFNLDLTAVNGSITANPPGPYYYGDEVTLTAAADTGYHFTGWSGDAEGGSSTTTVYINGNKSVTANFAINTYVLTINTTGSGSVGANPASSEYEHGTQVELSAEADPGWTFAGWSGDLQGTENPQSLIMDGPKSVTAVFTQDEYTLTITAEHGTVDASPAGPYHYGDQVTLTAAADPNFHFVNWSGDASGSELTTTVTMNGPRAVTANFAADTFVLSTETVGQGSITRDPDQNDFANGSTVELTATADPGWTFAGWSGDLQGTENPQSLIMDGPKSVIAVFTQDEYTLTITAEHGTVDASPAGPYHYGDQVTLTAGPDTGYHFTEWSGDITGTDSTTTITIYGNMSVTAGFVISEYTLTITAANGKVTRTPDLLTYHLGDVVRLVAEPNAGYKFAGWTDNLGNVYPRSLTIYITISGDISITANFDTIMKAYDIPLAAGWNYISLPVKPMTNDLATILQSISGKYAEIWSYNAAGQSWQTYIPGVSQGYYDGLLSNQITKLESMVDGQGYIIRMTDDAHLTGQGIEETVGASSPTTYRVYSGWNLIGFKTIDVNHDGIITQAADGLRAGYYLKNLNTGTLSGNYTVIGDQEEVNYFRYYSTADYSFHEANDNSILLVGHAYWMHYRLAANANTCIIPPIEPESSN